MNRAEAFLDEIARDPDDDGMRLIYADWLEEQASVAAVEAGPEPAARAELIRVQCERARLERDLDKIGGLRSAGDPEQALARLPELAECERALCATHERAWLGNAVGWLQGWQFRRGLLEYVSLTARDFLTHAADLFRLGPVRQVKLTEAHDHMAALAASPHLARLRFLNLSGNELGSTGLRPLFDSLHLGELSSLVLANNRIGPGGVQALASANPVGLGAGRLRHLDLTGNQVGVAGLEALVKMPTFDALASLELASCALTTTCALTLALFGTSPTAKPGALRRLSLAHNSISADGARALASTPRLARLTELSLASNPLGNEGAQHLARSRHLAALEVLDLSATRLGGEGAVALASSELPALRRLDLSGNHLGTPGAVALARGANLARLRSLNLAGNEIGDDGAKALAASPHLAHLTNLGLAANGLRAFGLKALTTSAHLGDLRSLDLRGNCLGDQGAQVLARWPGLARLIELNLRNNRVGDEGARALTASPYGRGLRRLDLSGNDITIGKDSERMKDEG